MAGGGNERGGCTVALPPPHDFIPIDLPYQQTGQIERRSGSGTQGFPQQDGDAHGAIYSSRGEAEEEALLSYALRHAAGLDMEPRDDDDDDDEEEERFVPPIPHLSLAGGRPFPSRAGRVASPAVAAKKLETMRYGGPEEGASADGSTGCVICIQDYEMGDEISLVPCSGKHRFHRECLDVWLTRKPLCPLCRHALPALLQRGLNQTSIS